ncbi:MAG: type II toxin-antitoxin system RelE/ParE family toxin [Gemmataceae bacterium]|nr:type II toxin-antitoxin system RelE/ParE family toxin [Gemmataceae bacterium]
MSLPITFQPAAEEEYAEAIDWFEALRPGGGAKFEAAVEATLARIGANPRLHAVVLADVRKAVVSGYPYYCVYYRERPADIEVLAVHHTSRDPAIWRGRVPPP